MTEVTAQGTAFDTLIYTDCRAGQGLRGEVGLQFQARSEGADGAAMALVQRHLLYEPPAKWMGERRPVSAYPPSFAHVRGEQLATAYGVYLGREVNGAREGNSLTHSVVTRDADAYGLVRPAQLLGAPFWTTQPAPTTACPAVPAGWAPGPFGPVEARDLVTSSPDGPAMLTALLSALEQVDQPDGRRVLFIAEDAALVVHWIAAATLLLPQERALAIGFKVFSTNPATATQPIIAVHPDWDSTPARVGNDLGYIVFDLTAGLWTEVAASRHALEWVDTFCTEDPYDVVDAIEVAAASRLPEDAAPIVGRTAILREAVTVRTAEVLVGWLRDSSPDLLGVHRGPIVDQLTVSVEQWPQRILLALDEVARAGQVPTDRIATVRIALIRAELARAGRDGTVSDVMLPSLPADAWGPEDQERAEFEVTDVLARAPVGSFDAMLRLAGRFNLDVRIDEIAEAAGRFVAYWADRPRAPYDYRLWPCGEAIDRMLDRELSARITQQPEKAATTGEHWWASRWTRAQRLASRLDEVVIGAAVKYLPADQRAGLVTRTLRSASAQIHPERAVPWAAGVLWSVSAPSYREITELANLSVPGTPLPGHLFGQLTADLLRDPLDPGALSVAQTLVKHRLWRPPASCARLLEIDQNLRQLVKAMQELGPDDPVPPGTATKVREVPEQLMRVWAGPLVGHLLDADHPRVMVVVVTTGPDQLREMFLQHLGKKLRAEPSDAQVVAALFLSHSKELLRREWEWLAGELKRWLNRVGVKRIKEVGKEVERYGPEWAAHWDDVVSHERSSNPAIRMTRRMRG